MAQKKIIKIAIVDDHPGILAGVKTMLATYPCYKVVITAISGVEFFKAAQKEKPDVVLLDYSFSGTENGEGFEILKKIKKDYPVLKVLMHSVYDGTYYVRQSLLLGANGYILKTTGPKEINALIKKAIDNEIALSKGLESFRFVENKSVKHSNNEPKGLPFTAREKEMLPHICYGLSRKTIADVMNISIKTVDNHISNIFHKTGLKNAQEVVSFCIRNNLVD